MYKKTKFTNQVTSNNGEIDLNMCENCSFKSIFCFCDLDLDVKQVTYNIICYFRYIILIKNIFPHFKIKYVPSADFYEIKNTVTDKFAF